MTKNLTLKKIKALRKNQTLIDDVLIILSKQDVEQFLKEDNPLDLIGLYTFYYYTAKWQKTNRPKAVKNYVLKGAKIGEPRFEKASKILQNMGLIQNVPSKDKKGKVTGWYIQVNFIWKQDTIDSLCLMDPQGRKLAPGKKPTILDKSNHEPVLPLSGIEKTNALNRKKFQILQPTATPSASPDSLRESVEAGPPGGTGLTNDLPDQELALVLPIPQTINKEMKKNIEPDILTTTANETWSKTDEKSVLDRLKENLKIEGFADDPKWIGIYGKNLADLEKKLGQEEFWRRVETLKADNFHSQHLGKPKYLYQNIRSMTSTQINWRREWYRFHVLAMAAYADVPVEDYQQNLADRQQKYFLFSDNQKLADLHMAYYLNPTYLEEYCYNQKAVEEAKARVLDLEGLKMSDFENMVPVYFGEQKLKTPLVFRAGKQTDPSWLGYLSPKQVKNN